MWECGWADEHRMLVYLVEITAWDRKEPHTLWSLKMGSCCIIHTGYTLPILHPLFPTDYHCVLSCLTFVRVYVCAHVCAGTCWVIFFPVSFTLTLKLGYSLAEILPANLARLTSHWAPETLLILLPQNSSSVLRIQACTIKSLVLFLFMFLFLYRF